MTNYLADLESLNKELVAALILLEEKIGSAERDKKLIGNIDNNTESLLQRCAEIAKESKAEKPLLRVIHHFACSGGTLISKCISAMPNTYLLSEVHPTTYLNIREKPEFRPTDIISLCRYAGIPNIDNLSRSILEASILRISEFLDQIGSNLVIREHTHSDYCLGENERDGSEVLKSLSGSFDIRSLVTIRDPIDSYLSLKNNKWAHFSPGNFEEYCRRYLTFLDNFEPSQVFKYENFVENPCEQMKVICDYMQLEFAGDFLDFYDIAKVTGDSGRKSSKISKRSRREISEDMRDEIKNSHSYRTIAEIYKYEF